MRRHLHSRAWARLVLLAVSIGVSVLLLELVCRLCFGPPLRPHRLFLEHDPLLGWRKIPGHQGEIVRDEYRTFESINSKGLRGPEIPYQRSPGRYRILVLGDSFAEGTTVDFEDLYSQALLGHLPEKDGLDLELINAGTSGYSTDQELL